MTAADLLTLARAGLPLPAWVTILSGRARPIAFWTTLLASTLLDWLDGSLARCIGPTPLGAVLDIEVDSWLTLSAVLAGVRLGRLPRPCAIPPVARYALAPGPAVDHRRWHHLAGRAQMAVLIAAPPAGRRLPGSRSRSQPCSWRRCSTWPDGATRRLASRGRAAGPVSLLAEMLAAGRTPEPMRVPA